VYESFVDSGWAMHRTHGDFMVLYADDDRREGEKILQPAASVAGRESQARERRHLMNAVKPTTSLSVYGVA